MRILSVNVFQLVKGADSEELEGLLTPSDRETLNTFLLQIVHANGGHFPVDPEAEIVICQCALNLFVNALKILYPTSTERSQLLTQYSEKYFDRSIQSNELFILQLLLTQLCDTNTLQQLMGRSTDKSIDEESTQQFGMNLFQSLLMMHRREHEAALGLIGSKSSENTLVSDSVLTDTISEALSSVCKTLLSYTSHITSSPDGNDLMFRFVLTLLESCEIILATSVDVDEKMGSELNNDVERALVSSPVEKLLSLTLGAFGVLMDFSPGVLQKATDDTIASIIKSLSKCQGFVQRLLNRMPKEMLRFVDR